MALAGRRALADTESSAATASNILTPSASASNKSTSHDLAGLLRPAPLAATASASPTVFERTGQTRIRPTMSGRVRAAGGNRYGGRRAGTETRGRSHPGRHPPGGRRAVTFHSPAAPTPAVSSLPVVRSLSRSSSTSPRRRSTTSRSASPPPAASLSPSRSPPSASLYTGAVTPPTQIFTAAASPGGHDFTSASSSPAAPRPLGGGGGGGGGAALQSAEPPAAPRPNRRRSTRLTGLDFDFREPSLASKLRAGMRGSFQIY